MEFLDARGHALGVAMSEVWSGGALQVWICGGYGGLEVRCRCGDIDSGCMEPYRRSTSVVTRKYFSLRERSRCRNTNYGDRELWVRCV